MRLAIRFGPPHHAVLYRISSYALHCLRFICCESLIGPFAAVQNNGAANQDFLNVALQSILSGLCVCGSDDVGSWQRTTRGKPEHPAS